MIKYLETFFEEKKLPYVTWELVSNVGNPHYIDSEVVIEHIGHAPLHEQQAIANVIRKIDLVNGDVNDYLKHLAWTLINE